MVVVAAAGCTGTWERGAAPGCDDGFPRGDYVDDYGTRHTVTRTRFDATTLLFCRGGDPIESGCGAGFRVGVDRGSGAFSKFAAVETETLHVCTVVFNASNAQDAALGQDYTGNLTAGCGGFPWSVFHPVAPPEIHYDSDHSADPMRYYAQEEDLL